MLIFSSVHWLFPPVSACWSPRTSHRASSPYPEGKCCSHLWWWKSWATYLHQWSHPEVTERWFFFEASFAPSFCFICFLFHKTTGARNWSVCSRIQFPKWSQYETWLLKNSAQSLRCKNLYLFMESKMPGHHTDTLRDWKGASNFLNLSYVTQMTEFYSAFFVCREITYIWLSYSWKILGNKLVCETRKCYILQKSVK